MISLLQVFRGLAALLVVYHHANKEVTELYGYDWLRSLFDLGDAGVQFFFVLSGFIIFWIHRKDVGISSHVTHFLKKRLIRIYPPYLLVTLALTPFWAFIPEFGAWYHKELSSFVYSVLLLPQSHVPNLGVGWTLTHEMLFYCLFAALIFSRQLGTAVLAIWFVAIIVFNITSGGNAAFPLSFFLSMNNLLFGLGIAGAIVILRKADCADNGWLFVTLGSGLFVLTGVIHNLLAEQGLMSPATSQLFILLFGLASLLVVLQSSSPSVEKLLSRMRLLNLIGAASFSLYLIHQPVISVWRKVLSLLGWHQSLFDSTLFFLSALLISILAGITMYQLIEKPLLNWLTRRLISSTSKRLNCVNQPALRGTSGHWSP